MSTEKTLKSIEQCKKLLLSNNRKGTVIYAEIAKKFAALALHSMHFYYLVYAGLLTKTSKGVYQMDFEKFKTVSNEVIFERSADALAKMKSKRVKSPPPYSHARTAKLTFRGGVCEVPERIGIQNNEAC